MLVITPNPWSDYALIDSGNGRRLEKFGPYTLSRPDPGALWQRLLTENDWQKADAIFQKADGREKWVTKNVPEKWLLHYQYLSFWAKLTPFKHTGVFPEQAVNWDWISQLIEGAKRPISVLNLFAYTGIASLVAAKAGAHVTHLDASKPSIAWAKENQIASHLENSPIRWIVDDAIKFTKREKNRGVAYDGIILDPPVYGHGPHGETWDFSVHFPILLSQCRALLSEKPLFILINAYAVSHSAITLANMLSDMTADFGGVIQSGELALKESGRGRPACRQGRLLSTGIFGRWSQ